MDTKTPPQAEPTAAQDRAARRSRWLRTAGLAAFAFFLIKGLAWLGAGAVLIMWMSE